jgi:RNA-directed DNA polymerase
VNTSGPPVGALRAELRVLEIQTKLHRWANDYLAQRDLWRAGCGANSHVRFGRAARGNGSAETLTPRLWPTPPRR